MISTIIIYHKTTKRNHIDTSDKLDVITSLKHLKYHREYLKSVKIEVRANLKRINREIKELKQINKGLMF